MECLEFVPPGKASIAEMHEAGEMQKKMIWFLQLAHLKVEETMMFVKGGFHVIPQNSSSICRIYEASDKGSYSPLLHSASRNLSQNE